MVKCSICGSCENWHLLSNKLEPEEIKYWNGSKQQNWYLCKLCGNAFPEPQASKEAIEYKWNNMRHEEDFFEKRMAALDKSAIKVFEYFKPYLQYRQNILDIGCGYGNLARILKDNGFNVIGVETDTTTKLQHLKYGLNTRIGSIEDISFKKKFDAIFLVYSIYFVTDIKQALLRLKKLMNNNGIICIVIADFLRCENNEMPSSVHSFYPCKLSICKLMEVVGLKVVNLKSSRGGIFCVIQKEPIKFTKLNFAQTTGIYFLYKTKRIRYLLVGQTIKGIASFINIVRNK